MTHSPLEPLLSPEGWAHASAEPVDAADPGRFHALFGRDSLILALQVLPRRPQVAAATLRALAARQGSVEDPETEEQPGRILHEDRPVAPDWLVQRGWPVRGGALRYFGTSDATSWFLVVLDATRDGGLAQELADARRAAGDWLERALRDGGGLVRCGPRPSPADWRSRAGATPSTRPPTSTGAGSCDRTARRRPRRSPMPTRRRSRSLRWTRSSGSTPTPRAGGRGWRHGSGHGSRRSSSPT